MLFRDRSETIHRREGFCYEEGISGGKLTLAIGGQAKALWGNEFEFVSQVCGCDSASFAEVGDVVVILNMGNISQMRSFLDIGASLLDNMDRS